MVATNYGRSGCALLFAGSANVPRYCAIGSGSGANVATLGSLIAEVLSQRTDFTSRDISAAKKVTYVYDFTSTSMSGVSLREFGVAGSQLKGVNDLWLREAFAAITFDGSNELQIEVTFEIF